MNRRAFALMSTVVLAFGLAAGCSQPAPEGPMEETGAAADNAMDDMQEGMEDAGEAAEEGGEEAASEAEPAAEGAN